jgi:hypothetical protein
MTAVLVKVLQGEVMCKVLAHMIMEAEKSYDLPSTSWNKLDTHERQHCSSNANIEIFERQRAKGIIPVSESI